MLEKIATLISDLDTTKALLSFRFSGYLMEIGWFNAFKNNKPIDANGQPIPWVSYPFISFIENRLKNNFKIFEYGCGNSTLYYAKKVNTVTAVEHDKNWYEQIKIQMPTNVNLIYEKLEYDAAYCRAAMQTNQKYDIIIIDGRDRNNCVLNSIPALSEKGVIILDNSDRIDYMPCYDIMTSNNFKNIEFWGLAPGFLHTTCTTVFYKPLNCLEI